MKFVPKAPQEQTPEEEDAYCAAQRARIDAAFKNETPIVDCAHAASGYFNWGWKGIGFGQFSFGFNRETKKWYCDTEGMGPETTRKLLHAFADFVADQLTEQILEEQRAIEARCERRREEIENRSAD